MHKIYNKISNCSLIKIILISLFVLGTDLYASDYVENPFSFISRTNTLANKTLFNRMKAYNPLNAFFQQISLKILDDKFTPTKKGYSRTNIQCNLISLNEKDLLNHKCEMIFYDSDPLFIEIENKTVIPLDWFNFKLSLEGLDSSDIITSLKKKSIGLICGFYKLGDKSWGKEIKYAFDYSLRWVPMKTCKNFGLKAFVVFQGVLSPLEDLGDDVRYKDRYDNTINEGVVDILDTVKAGKKLFIYKPGAGIEAIVAALNGIEVTVLCSNETEKINIETNAWLNGIDKRKLKIITKLNQESKFDYSYFNAPRPIYTSQEDLDKHSDTLALGIIHDNKGSESKKFFRLSKMVLKDKGTIICLGPDNNSYHSLILNNGLNIKKNITRIMLGDMTVYHLFKDEENVFDESNFEDLILKSIDPATTSFTRKYALLMISKLISELSKTDIDSDIDVDNIDVLGQSMALIPEKLLPYGLLKSLLKTKEQMNSDELRTKTFGQLKQKIDHELLVYEEGLQNDHSINPYSTSGLLKIGEQAKILSKKKTGYFVKNSIIKKILKINPPVKLMGFYNVDNLNDLYKELSIEAVFSLGRYIEDPEWTKNNFRKYANLSSDDLEEREIKVIIFDKLPLHVQKYFKGKLPFSNDKIVGTLTGYAVPHLKTNKIPTIRAITRALHYIFEISFYSEIIEERIFDRHDDKKTIGEALSDTLSDNITIDQFFEPHALVEVLFMVEAMDVLQNNYPLVFPEKLQELPFLITDYQDGLINVTSIIDRITVLSKGYDSNLHAQRYLRLLPILVYLKNNLKDTRKLLEVSYLLPEFLSMAMKNGFNPRRATPSDINALTKDYDNLVEKLITTISKLNNHDQKIIDQLLVHLNKTQYEKKLRSMYNLNRQEANLVDKRIAAMIYRENLNLSGWTMPVLKSIKEKPELLKECLKDASYIKQNFNHVIFAGMGGSGLISQMINSAFPQENINMYNLMNTDPKAVKDLLAKIAQNEGSNIKTALNKVLIVLVSRKGTTKEVIAFKKYFDNLFKTHIGSGFEKHFWIITTKDSPLISKGYTYRNVTLMNNKTDFHGRFLPPSTYIFWMPLALAAPDRVFNILNQTIEMNEVKDARNDQFLRVGAFLYHMAANRNKNKLTILMPEKLKNVTKEWEHALEHSLNQQGKSISIFMDEKLEIDNLKDAIKDQRVFLRINLGKIKTKDSLWQSLIINGYPTTEINLKDIDQLGGLMHGFQRIIAVIGYFWNTCISNTPKVNSLKPKIENILKENQNKLVPISESWEYAGFKNIKFYYGPFLELGIITRKELKNEILKLQGTAYNAKYVYAAILRILNRKNLNFEAAELAFYGKLTPTLNTVFKNARHNIFTSILKMACKLSEGPQRNHSHQSGVINGKDMWLTHFFMSESYDQPEISMFDPNLLRAQALATFEVIIERGRKAFFFSLKDNSEKTLNDLNEFFNSVKKLLLQDDYINENESLKRKNYLYQTDGKYKIFDYLKELIKDYRIKQNNKQTIKFGVSGISGAGKTTLFKSFINELELSGEHVVSIPLTGFLLESKVRDQIYADAIDNNKAIPDERDSIFHLNALRELFRKIQDFDNSNKDEDVIILKNLYDRATGKKDKIEKIKVTKNSIIIIEGVPALRKEFLKYFNFTFMVVSKNLKTLKNMLKREKEKKKKKQRSAELITKRFKLFTLPLEDKLNKMITNGEVDFVINNQDFDNPVLFAISGLEVYHKPRILSHKEVSKAA